MGSIPPLWARPVAYDAWHYLAVLTKKPGALRNGAPFMDWLPGSIGTVQRKLGRSDEGDRQMVDILTAVLTDGLSAVEAACAEALAAGIASADVILNILARRQRAAATSARSQTPARLALQRAAARRLRSLRWLATPIRHPSRANVSHGSL